MRISKNVLELSKRYNNKNNIKEKLTILLGANITNSILSAFLFLTGVSNQEKKSLARNIEFKDMYKDQKCFILGNGPSVKNMDLSVLVDEKVFTVNQFTRTKIYKEIKPSFHLWSDERFFKLNENDKGDMEILSDMKNAKISTSKPIVFYKISAKKMIEKYKLDSVLNIYYYSDNLIFDDKYKKEVDMCRSIPWFPTVVQYAIFFAIYMGFSEIYLLGCECSGILNFIKEKDNNSFINNYSYTYELNKNEQHNFRKAIEPRTSAQEFIGHYKVFKYYEYLIKYCRKHNVKLVNCTPGGLLDSIPRCEFKDVMR